MNAKKKLIDVAHISKRVSSLRISIPKKIAESIGVSDGERIFVERIEQITEDFQKPPPKTFFMTS